MPSRKSKKISDVKAVPTVSDVCAEIFSDAEATRTLVGFFDLALKVAERNPILWAEINSSNNKDHD